MSALHHVLIFVILIFYYFTHWQVKLSANNVFDRGLVSEMVKGKDITKEYKSYCDVEREVKHFPGETLAYVTPV